ncbi:MAG: response regulator [SAR92 clade bacterium]|mgnify:FL=1|uniref:Response regulator n=1 Tax=SAR92 clade bacterium TaxID=2315479 RepID=A0A520MIQ2_9GAMM|nr:MAG: response regulator [SAR92 clade bacterium]
MNNPLSKILVVEDEEIIRTSLVKLLVRHNYAVDDAVSVKAALSRYNIKEFNLIISDLRLPGNPGSELINLAGTVPVIIMTSYASLRSAVDIMRQGAVDYISKPFDHEELIQSVKRALSNTAQNQDKTDNLPEVTSHSSKGSDFMSLEEYFAAFVTENQDQMSETVLAEKLGISRKSLWERRNKLGITRNKK